MANGKRARKKYGAWKGGIRRGLKTGRYRTKCIRTKGAYRCKDSVSGKFVKSIFCSGKCAPKAKKRSKKRGRRK